MEWEAMGLPAVIEHIEMELLVVVAYVKLLRERVTWEIELLTVSFGLLYVKGTVTRKVLPFTAMLLPARGNECQITLLIATCVQALLTTPLKPDMKITSPAATDCTPE